MLSLRRFASRCLAAARNSLIPRPAPKVRRSDHAVGDEYRLDLSLTTPVATHSSNGAVRQVMAGDGADGLRIALPAGHGVVTPPIAAGCEQSLQLRAAGEGTSRGQLRIDVTEAGVWRTQALWTPQLQPQSFELDLGSSDDGARQIRVVAVGGAIALFEFLVGARHRRGRLHALTSYAHRVQNEAKHFAGALYAKAMLGDLEAGPDRGDGILRAATRGDATTDFAADLGRRAEALLATMPPAPGENAFAYAMRGLGALLPITPPDFFARARERSSKGPMSILSLCAGAARVEEQILAHCQGPVRLTLLDASEELIQRAADRLSRTGSGHTVDCLIGDVNRGLPGNDRYDVIVCVSALHHVADLETVLAQTNERLVDDGEFWSIGEQIGRNGNRLWPDALLAANRAFAQLPERLRRNAHSGLVDASVSDHDFSVASFEGIRSEELETMLEAHFVPVHVFKRNAFLWRLVDSTYGGNFDLAVAAHLAALRQLVVAEAVHWATGGRSTELHGVYRKKTLRAPPPTTTPTTS
jgi:SAM-dependent methyltransferase